MQQTSIVRQIAIYHFQSTIHTFSRLPSPILSHTCGIRFSKYHMIFPMKSDITKLHTYICCKRHLSCQSETQSAHFNNIFYYTFTIGSAQTWVYRQVLEPQGTSKIKGHNIMIFLYNSGIQSSLEHNELTLDRQYAMSIGEILAQPPQPLSHKSSKEKTSP